MAREERRLSAAVYGWASPPFKLWATLRAIELSKRGESAALVIYFNKQSFDAGQLELIGEPEFAVRRASGAIERSPVVEPPPALRIVYRRHG